MPDGRYDQKSGHTEGNKHVHWLLDRMLSILKTPGEKKNQDRVVSYKGHPIDRMSRILFPFGYILFVATYLIYYLKELD